MALEASRPDTPLGSPEPARWPLRRVLGMLVPLFLLLVYPVGFRPDGAGPNERAHAYLAMALYERGEVRLDQEVFDYDLNRDLVFRNGGFYSNKPPGAGLWLLPAAFLVDVFTPGPIDLTTLLWVGRILLLTLPFVLFLFLLGRTLERIASPAVAWGLVLAYALGTNAGAYATRYFSHDLAGMALGTAFILIWIRPDRLRWLAGLLTGFALLGEYQTLGIALVIAALAAFDGHGRFRLKHLLLFGVGAAAILVLLLIYNEMAFGRTTQVSYAKELKDFGLQQTTFYGFSLPRAGKLLEMAFSPALGLFFFSPWLLLLAPAAVWVIRRRPPQWGLLLGAAAAALALPAVIFLHRYWIGGAIVGPRYLTAGLPFFLFPLAAFLDRAPVRVRMLSRGVLVTGAVVGIAVHFGIILAAIAVDTAPEFLNQNPLSSYVLPLLLEGRAALTLATFFGSSVALSNTLFVLLLAATLTGFALPCLRAASGLGRFGLGCSTGVGLALLVIWPQFGSSESSFSRTHLDWLRSATNPDVYGWRHGHVVFRGRPGAMTPERADQARFHRFRKAVDAILPPEPALYRIATNFRYAKGPVWMPEGYLLFSDLQKNVIYRYDPAGRISFERTLAGYAVDNVAWRQFVGPSGLAVDREGRLIMTEVGHRCITRREKDGRHTTLADRYQGKQLHGPSDVAVKSDGTVYFTDPRYALQYDDWREMDWSGIYRVVDGRVQCLSTLLGGPQGLAFSPDERFLYVGNWNGRAKVLTRFEVRPDGTLGDLQLFLRLDRVPLETRMDGLGVDQAGNVYVCSPDGILIASPGGQPLGLIQTPEPPSSFAWGDADRRTLYITSFVSLYRTRVLIPGAR